MGKKNRVKELFKEKRMVLIASLPGNSAELAEAAEAGGVDMLKVHLNVEHAASGIRFGSLKEEITAIESILEAVSIPVGIMPGAATVATLEEMRELESMGVAFFDIYARDMPVEYMSLEKMLAMPAMDSEWKRHEPKELRSAGFSMLEASIVKHEKYGSRLVLSDLLNYSYIASKFGGAVIVPTQKAISPEEVHLLAEAGVAGMMIGKIVTGDSAAELEASAKRFRKSADNL